MKAQVSLPILVQRQGSRSVVRQARMGDKLVIIKLTEKRNSFPLESWFYKQVAKVKVPVPSVYFYCARLPFFKLPCLVISHIDGVPLFSYESDIKSEILLYQEVGILLQRIHSVELPELSFGVGAFISSHGRVKDLNWATFVTETHSHPASGLYLSKQDNLVFYSPEELEKLSALIDAHRFSAVLNHGDFGPDHIFIEDGHISGVIDPGDAFAGPAEYDIAYLSCYIESHQLHAVLCGYGRPLNQKMILAYAKLIALDKAARAHRNGQIMRSDYFKAIAARNYLFTSN